MIWEEFYFSAPERSGDFAGFPDVPFPVRLGYKLFTLTPTLFMWHIISPEGTETEFNTWRDFDTNQLGWEKFGRPNLSDVNAGKVFDKFMNAIEARSSFILGAGENEYYAVAKKDGITGAPALPGVPQNLIKQWTDLLPYPISKRSMILWHIASTATEAQFEGWRDIDAGKVGYMKGERPSISDALKKKAFMRILDGIEASHEFGGFGQGA